MRSLEVAWALTTGRWHVSRANGMQGARDWGNAAARALAFAEVYTLPQGLLVPACTCVPQIGVQYPPHWSMHAETMQRLSLIFFAL